MALPVLSYRVVLSLLSLLSFLIVYVLLQQCKRKPPPGSNLIPLPPSPPSLPIIGNLHQLGPLPHRSLRILSERHGPLMLLHLGHIPTLVVSCANATRDIFKNHDAIFSSRPSFKVGHALLYGMMDMAFAPYGDYWKQTRKLCVTHLLSSKMVQSFNHMREDEVALMIGEIGASTGVVDMSEVLNSFANGFLCRVISGKFSKGRENLLRDILETACKGTKKVKKRLQILRKKFEVLEMKDTEVVSNYFTGVFSVVNKLRRNAENIEDLRVFEKILRSLTLKYDHVVVAIEEGNNLDELTVNDLMGSLEAHEQLIKRRHEEPMEQALQTKLNMKDEQKEESEGHYEYQHVGYSHRYRGNRGRGGFRVRGHQGRNKSVARDYEEYSESSNISRDHSRGRIAIDTTAI